MTTLALHFHDRAESQPGGPRTTHQQNLSGNGPAAAAAPAGATTASGGASAVAAGAHESDRTTFTAWGMPVEITAPQNLLPGARALVHRLERLWNPTRADSDLHRLFARVGTMVTVEPETVALVELATRAAWHAPEPPMALHDVFIDTRRNRVGLPADEILDFRATVPALTAALVTHYLQENGADAVHVRVGDSHRADAGVQAT